MRTGLDAEQPADTGTSARHAAGLSVDLADRPVVARVGQPGKLAGRPEKREFRPKTASCPGSTSERKRSASAYKHARLALKCY